MATPNVKNESAHVQTAAGPAESCPQLPLTMRVALRLISCPPEVRNTAEDPEGAHESLWEPRKDGRQRKRNYLKIFQSEVQKGTPRLSEGHCQVPLCIKALLQLIHSAPPHAQVQQGSRTCKLQRASPGRNPRPADHFSMPHQGRKPTSPQLPPHLQEAPGREIGPAASPGCLPPVIWPWQSKRCFPVISTKCDRPRTGAQNQFKLLFTGVSIFTR